MMRISKMMTWWWVALVLGTLGCDRPGDKGKPAPVAAESPAYDFLTTLPFSGSPMDILTDDMDGDGRQDVAATSHVLNYSQIFYQKTPRRYQPGEKLDAVGFHAGDWLRWPVGADRVYLAAAEGLRQLLGFKLTQAGQMDIVAKVPALAPRNLEYFNWPGWGDSLVTTPFEAGALEFFGGFDPVQGTSARRVRITIGETSNSIRKVERVTLGDVDGDGVDEILFASRTTGEIFKVAQPRGKNDPKAEVIFELGESAPHQVIAVDLNGDGAKDLIVPDQVEPFQVNLLLNDGKGRFRRSASTLPFPEQQGIRYADFGRDKDDRGYLAVVGYGAIAVYQIVLPWGEGHPVPVRSIKIGSRGMSSDIVLRDLDADGWLDLAVGYGSSEHGVAVVHGPLWEHMETLASDNFVLK
ncbi:MAG: hypothetical protein RLZZ09_1587 [Pseudomonadota bacterium]|jgi:hypothetical protein